MAKQATAAASSETDDPTVNADKRTVQDYLDVPLGVSEGPAKNVKTVGDLLTSYGEIVKEQGKTSRELKTATDRLSALEDKADDKKGGTTTELWDKAVSDVEEHGHITSETLATLEKATGIPANVFTNVVTVMEKADEAFGVKTKEILGVTTAELHELLTKAGYSDAYREFMQDQVIAGRYGFLSDVVEDLKSKGLVDAKTIGQKGDGDGDGDSSPDGGPGKPPQQREQVDMGVPPGPPKPDKGWESDAAFSTEFNEAKSAEQKGEPGKMETIKARMTALETAGQEFYPGSPKSIVLG